MWPYFGVQAMLFKKETTPLKMQTSAMPVREGSAYRMLLVSSPSIQLAMSQLCKGYRQEHVNTYFNTLAACAVSVLLLSLTSE